MKKTILITGANKGIGYEIARQLAKLEHTVILTARDEIKGKAAVERLGKENLQVSFLRLDVTDLKQFEEIKKKVASTFGHLDVLINNAGIMMKDDKKLTYGNSFIWSETMAVNAVAALELSLLFAPDMPRNSSIINISSGGGSMSDPVGGWSPVYCISKTTLNAITRHLAFSLEPSGISVNAVCPGWVKTDMGTSSAPRSVEKGADTAVWLASQTSVPSGKFWRDRKEIPW